ncbi:MAG: tetratricopeptide repeat protein [Anaerolineae bacterium]
MTRAELYSFGDWVKQRRLQLRLTQRELASLTYCSVPMIKKIESDERRPSSDLAKLLLVALQIPTADQESFLEVARGDHAVDTLAHPQAATAWAPTTTISTSLPTLATPFVGRVDELATIDQRLNDPDCRLLTLIGPGGIGKTRLALAAAQLQRSRYVEGVCFIPLAAISDAKLIPDAIAQSLRLGLSGSPNEQVIVYLRRHPMLLVLDNCEQLDDDLHWLSELLAQASGVKLLATSRVRLRLEEEWIFAVPGLTQAVSLFTAAAQRVKANFDLEREKTAVAHICRLVENLPLAIELAAAWVRIMPCAEIAREIEHNLDILATDLRNVPDKHRSMRAAIDHSWRLLAPQEQSVFSELSVFRGGFTREAAEIVAHTSLLTLASLVDKSLLHVEVNGRYDIHELLKQYAFEKLEEANEQTAARNRHCDYFVAHAEKGERDLFGQNQVEALSRAEKEIDNFRAALVWSRESGNIVAHLRLIIALHHFWFGHQHDAKQYRIDVLSLEDSQVPANLRAKALYAAADIQLYEGNHAAAIPVLERASAIARELGALDVLVLTVRSLGYAHCYTGDFDAALVHLEESVQVARQLNDSYGVGWSFAFIGDVMLGQNKLELAQHYYQDSIEILKPFADVVLHSYVCCSLGLVMRRLQDYERSKAIYVESLKLSMQAGIQANIAASLVGLAGTALAEGNPLDAVQLLSAANSLINEIAATLIGHYQTEYETHSAVARSLIDSSTFEHYWALGQAMTIDKILTFIGVQMD